MRKLVSTAFVTMLMVSVLGPSLWAATHNFKLHFESTISGIQLRPGKYRVDLDGNEATIYQRGKVVARARVEVKEGRPVQRNSIVKKADGTILEIRLKNQTIVFPR